MQIDSSTIARYGGQAVMEARVAAFAAALDAHRFTVGVPAPVEEELIERLARSGEAIEPRDPQDEQGEKGPSLLAEVAERMAKLEAALIAKTVITKADVDAATTEATTRAEEVRP